MFPRIERNFFFPQKEVKLLQQNNKAKENNLKKERQYVRWLMSSPPGKRVKTHKRSCDFKRTKKRGLYTMFPPLTTRKLGGDERRDEEWLKMEGAKSL